MQFPVPQFTDVEDRIVGGLTFKQFGIVFIAGVLIFAVYTVTKSIPATIVAGLFLGFPAAILTFAKLNGRPIYSSFGNAVTFLFGQKIYFFEKQSHRLPEENQPVVITEVEPVMDVKQKAVKVKQLSYLLHQQREQESTLIQRLSEDQAK